MYQYRVVHPDGEIVEQTARRAIREGLRFVNMTPIAPSMAELESRLLGTRGQVGFGCGVYIKREPEPMYAATFALLEFAERTLEFAKEKREYGLQCAAEDVIRKAKGVKRE